MRIIASQGGMEPECFATNTGLMLSFAGEDGKVHSVVRRIKHRQMNLEKVSRLAKMAQALATDTMSFDEASSEMDAIERMREHTLSAKVGAGALGAAFLPCFLVAGSWTQAPPSPSAPYSSSRSPPSSAGALPDFLASLAGGALATLASLAVH